MFVSIPTTFAFHFHFSDTKQKHQVKRSSRLERAARYMREISQAHHRSIVLYLTDSASRRLSLICAALSLVRFLCRSEMPISSCCRRALWYEEETPHEGETVTGTCSSVCTTSHTLDFLESCVLALECPSAVRYLVGPLPARDPSRGDQYHTRKKRHFWPVG